MSHIKASLAGLGLASSSISMKPTDCLWNHSSFWISFIVSAAEGFFLDRLRQWPSYARYAAFSPAWAFCKIVTSLLIKLAILVGVEPTTHDFRDHRSDR